MTQTPSRSIDELLAPLPPALADAVRPWCTEPRFADDRPALLALLERAGASDAHARAELEDAFSGPLPIGTGGRRGAVGPGPNRMNVVVVRETARGVAQMVRDEGAPALVVVAYDTRTHSRPFAHAVADQLADEGLDVLLVDAPRPTPELSFLVRARGAGAGVVISASHNPPGDNGIKVYGPDGAQVLGARDRALMAAIERAMITSAQPAARRGSVEIAASERELAAVDDPYHAFVRAQGVLPGSLADGVRVVYTPLHGVGHTAVLPVLGSRGLDLAVVEAQLPDGGAFATVPSANPEVPEALALAIAQAERDGAQLVLATDPDADRLGAAARDGHGQLAFVDGNRLGVLMLDHVLRHASLPKDGWVLTTLVTSPLVATLARAAGVDVVDDLLVGFKHHAGMLAEAPTRPLVFACEESHGYVRGNDVHDKDGAVAALLLAECATDAARRGSDLAAELDRIFMIHGYHRERTANLYAYGAAGRDAIARLVETWRRTPPTAFAGLSVVEMIDRARPRGTGSATRDLPGNVLVFELAAPGGRACRLVVRPSGTEPKAKVYALGRGPASADLDALAGVRVEIDRMVDDVLADARARAEAVMAGGSG